MSENSKFNKTIKTLARDEQPLVKIVKKKNKWVVASTPRHHALYVQVVKAA